MSFFLVGHFESLKSAILNFFLLHSHQNKSKFIGQQGFFKILMITLFFSPKQHPPKHMQNSVYTIETFQDFLIKLDIKPLMHLLKISIFSLNNVILRLTKIMNRADKNWAHFQEIKYFKNQSFQKISLIKVGLLIKYSAQKKKFGKIRPILDTEK